MDTNSQTTTEGDTPVVKALSTAGTLASAGNADCVSATVQDPGPLKRFWAVVSAPKVDSWLQDISQSCNDPLPGIRLDQPAILPRAQPEKSTTPSPDPAFRHQPPTGPRSTYATVLAGKNRPTHANISAGVLGPGPQPLRGIPGFPGQQAPQTRTAPLGSGRLQNGKIGALLLESYEHYLQQDEADFAFARERFHLGIWHASKWCTGATNPSSKTHKCGHDELCANDRWFSACYTFRSIVSL